jgi:hypothetical protein
MLYKTPLVFDFSIIEIDRFNILARWHNVYVSSQMFQQLVPYINIALQYLFELQSCFTFLGVTRKSFKLSSVQSIHHIFSS